jgi:hypothetical protein
MINGQDIKELYLPKISWISKIAKLNKHMIIVKEKWIKDAQNKDNKE